MRPPDSLIGRLERLVPRKPSNALGDDRWRVVEGHELGEVLRVVRDDDGTPVKPYLATYPLTRAPAAFADSASE